MTGPIRFEIAGAPVPKSRPIHGSGRVYTPRATREYEEWVAMSARAARARVGDEQVEVSLELHHDLVVVELQPITEELRWMPRGDLDNYAKSILDGLQRGGVFTNDRQVVELHVRTVWPT